MAIDLKRNATRPVAAGSVIGLGAAVAGAQVTGTGGTAVDPIDLADATTGTSTTIDTPVSTRRSSGRPRCPTTRSTTRRATPRTPVDESPDTVAVSPDRVGASPDSVDVSPDTVDVSPDALDDSPADSVDHSAASDGSDDSNDS